MSLCLGPRPGIDPPQGFLVKVTEKGMKTVFALTELWMWDSMVFYCRYKMTAWYMEHTQRTNAHPHDGISLCFRSPQTGYQTICTQLSIPSFFISVFHFQATLVCPQNSRNFHLTTSKNASSVLRLASSHILTFLKVSCILQSLPMETWRQERWYGDVHRPPGGDGVCTSVTSGEH